MVLLLAAMILHRSPHTWALGRTECEEPKPINDVDPVTGKKVDFGAPTERYKGYTIGFCCPLSRTEGGWERLSEKDKDAFIGRFVKPEATSGDEGRSHE